MRMPSRYRASRGFTLIESVMVIVIIGVISAVVAVFIRSPVQGYVDTVNRAQLTDVADVALRRFSREVRLALPNSVRVLSAGGMNYIEFIPTSAGGRYRHESDGSSAGDFLSYKDTTDVSFDVLGAMPSSPAMAVKDYIVVNNLGDGYAPGNAYVAADPCSNCNRAKITAVSGNVVTLASNPFASQAPPLPSPNHRFQVVPSGTKAVTYACPSSVAGNLSRYADYGFSAVQAAPGGSPALLASGVTCTVDYTSAATGRNGLLYLGLTLTNASNGESVSLFHQVHVDNSP